VLLFNLLVFTRMSFQIQRRALALFALPTERVLIVGAERMGVAAVRYIFSGSDRRMRLVGFVDDDAFMEGKLVHGHQVLGPLDDLPRIYLATGFHRILIAADGIREDRLAIVMAFADAQSPAAPVLLHRGQRIHSWPGQPRRQQHRQERSRGATGARGRAALGRLRKIVPDWNIAVPPRLLFGARRPQGR